MVSSMYYDNLCSCCITLNKGSLTGKRMRRNDNATALANRK